MPPSAIIKRNGETVPFDRHRIAAAINRAQRAVGADDATLADELATVVVDHLDRIVEDGSPDIETVQDAVLYVLQESGNYDVALAYARYRDARERSRRERALEEGESPRPNLHVLRRDGRRRPWQAETLERMLRSQFDLPTKVAGDVRLEVEKVLSQSDLTELDAHLLLSLIDASLVKHGLADVARDRAALRIDRDFVRDILGDEDEGELAVSACGREVLHNLSLNETLPIEVRRLYMQGRLWVDGLDDCLRGSHFTAALDGCTNPWEILTRAYALAVEARRDWRRVSVILPPSILGTLERDEGAELIESIERLGMLADVNLYCDGRTPLLEQWPFQGKTVSLATYAQDFLILRRLQELGLHHLSGPTLMQGGYRRRVAVSLALNAQGLDDHFSQLDHLAMGLVAAARVRLEQLARPALAGANVRYAIYGLPPGSSSTEYLERQVVQEGLRCGIALARTSSLPEEACVHLGRLFGSD
jgi:transcriptional regulator NrdR family protein